jgi:catechol 2,3-dioxygenase-like lactoylglutathione lyase family enzyme
VTDSGSEPKIDLENVPAPAEGILVTHFLIVRDVARSRAFYADVLGGQVVLEENPCIVKLANSWIIMNPGGGPTPDKPDISVVPYEPSNEVSSFLNLRVADIDACYRDWKAKGAEFVTEPIDRMAEVRCYMRDPDGYLIEVGQATGMLEGNSRRSGARTCPAEGWVAVDQRRAASEEARPQEGDPAVAGSPPMGDRGLEPGTSSLSGTLGGDPLSTGVVSRTANTPQTSSICSLAPMTSRTAMDKGPNQMLGEMLGGAALRADARSETAVMWRLPALSWALA